MDINKLRVDYKVNTIKNSNKESISVLEQVYQYSINSNNDENLIQKNSKLNYFIFNMKMIILTLLKIRFSAVYRFSEVASNNLI